MMLFDEEAKVLLKQLEKLFKKLVVRIVDFQNDWDRCDPIWRFCWQNRKGKWFETRISYYNGVYFIVNWGGKSPLGFLGLGNQSRRVLPRERRWCSRSPSLAQGRES